MASLSHEDLATAANKLAAGRIIATESHPYLSKSIFAMVPVPREGLGTFAVDKRWRMYYDPAVCLEWSTKEIAAVWLHEVGHLIRDHSKRFEQFSEPQHMEKWNHAADAAINSDLREEGVLLPLPDRRFYAESNLLYPEWAPGMSTEELYSIAKGVGQGAQEDPPPSGNSKPEEDSDSSDSSPEDTDASDPEDTSEQEDDDSDSSANDSEEAPEGYQEGSSDEDEQDESSQEDSDLEGSGSDESASENASGSLPDVTDCGSGATGGKRDYEEPEDANDGSLDPDEAELVRQATAKDIMDAANAGNVPAGMVREANELLNPQVDWRQELMSLVRRVCATVAGQKDYSYRRPSRRSAMTSFYLPSMRAPRPPEIAVVLDTSGSMSAADLAVALSEIQGILQRSASSSKSSLRIINCDADAKDIEAVQSVEDIAIIGGGGTDMRIGIKTASELRPKPDAIITVTDGGTPWPKQPDDPHIVYINVIVQAKSGSNAKYQWSKPPEWMRTIYVDRRLSR